MSVFPLERETIDAQFASMSGDEAYQRLALSIAQDFSDSDWEATGEHRSPYHS